VSGRVADYIREYVDRLSILVAHEDITLRTPRKRTVRSDYLLVRYPGSDRSLLMLRDVLDENGAPVRDREDRLVELFQKEYTYARVRADEITHFSARYVPAVLNPLLAIALLQPEYQSRFSFQVKDAERTWPDEVSVLEFKETAKPTLLRSSPTARGNVPTRGRVWIEMPAGRILQTELQVNDRGKITTLATTFQRDERLDMLVPGEMRTKAPDGVAVYTNYRRFDVEALQGNFRCVDGRTAGGVGCFDKGTGQGSPTQEPPAERPAPR
jgi:hypothetical protein